MLPVIFDDPLFGGICGPGITGSPGLTDITYAGQRHVMPLRGPVAKTTGLDQVSQREEREMDWVYCDCAGTHKPDCPNNKPGGFPPLNDDDD